MNKKKSSTPFLILSSIGLYLVAFGESTLLWIAKTFGTSLGEPIACLSGEAQRLAATAWIAGGSLAKGGGGVPMGEKILLAMPFIGTILFSIGVILMIRRKKKIADQ